MTNNFFLIYAFFFGMCVLSALALAVFITYLILKKNNDFGDFAPKLDEYSTGIRYGREVDDVTSHERTILLVDYGENPYKDRTHRYPEQLLKKPDDYGQE